MSISETVLTPHFQPFLPDSVSVFLYCHVSTNSLFQGKPLSRESFPGNHFSRELFHKTSFQKVTVPTGIFSKKALFQWDCVSARTLFRETVSQESCLGMDHIFKGIVSARTFFKGTLFRGIVSQNPGMSRNYSQITVPNNLFDVSELALYL